MPYISGRREYANLLGFDSSFVKKKINCGGPGSKKKHANLLGFGAGTEN